MFGPICLEQQIRDPLIQEIQEIQTQKNEV